MLANVLNNAAKYTHEGGKIQLRTEVRVSRVLIEISDNGIGMAPDLIARVFDLFSQAERSSDRSSGGLGLGLALVKSLIELHHGTVTCESAGVGKGSKFTLCLPRLIPPQDQQDGGQSSTVQVPPKHSLSIMVVDDNVDAATMLAMLLEASGHRVAVEHGAHAALRRVNEMEIAPDVCLLDIGLPDIDGIELARRLRQLPATADSLLIATTGYGQENDRNQTKAAGFDHHLVKSIDIKELLLLLKGVSP